MPDFVSIGNGDPVDVSDVQVAPGDAPSISAAPAQGLYVVLLINMTDLCIEYGQKSYNRCNEPNVQYFAVPRTCRTCNLDCNGCHDAQAWQAVLTVACTDSPFYLTLITRPDQNGNARGACWRISPNCQYSGGSICLS